MKLNWITGDPTSPTMTLTKEQAPCMSPLCANAPHNTRWLDGAGRRICPMATTIVEWWIQGGVTWIRPKNFKPSAKPSGTTKGVFTDGPLNGQDIRIGLKLPVAVIDHGTHESEDVLAQQIHSWPWPILMAIDHPEMGPWPVNDPSPENRRYGLYGVYLWQNGRYVWTTGFHEPLTTAPIVPAPRLVAPDRTPAPRSPVLTGGPAMPRLVAPGMGG